MRKYAVAVNTTLAKSNKGKGQAWSVCGIYEVGNLEYEFTDDLAVSADIFSYLLKCVPICIFCNIRRAIWLDCQ